MVTKLHIIRKLWRIQRSQRSEKKLHLVGRGSNNFPRMASVLYLYQMYASWIVTHTVFYVRSSLRYKQHHGLLAELGNRPRRSGPPIFVRRDWSIWRQDDKRWLQRVRRSLNSLVIVGLPAVRLSHRWILGSSRRVTVNWSDIWTHYNRTESGWVWDNRKPTRVEPYAICALFQDNLKCSPCDSAIEGRK
jgi:hypothetical protein